MIETPATQPAAPRRRPLGRLLVFGVLVGACIAIYRADLAARPSLVAGPMVQIVAPGQLAFVWRAESAGDSLGRLRTSDGSTIPATVNQLGYFVARAPAGSAVDSYRVDNTGLFGRNLELYTGACIGPAPRGKPFRFLAFGDSGNGSNTQTALAERMSATGPDLVIHVGDLVYPAGVAEDYARNFFEPNRSLIARVAFMPCLGNHDAATQHGQPLLDTFVLPENGPQGVQPERNYWFDFGDARFVALDTNRAEELGVITESDMRAKVAPWLRRVLTECDARWKFVFFHHPPYTGSTHKSADQAFVKEIFVPIFDECGVDVVFAGHNHLYERTRPIRGDRVVADGAGTVYVVTGAGGVSRYPESQPPPDYIAYYNSEVFSFTQIDLTVTRLSLTQIALDGKPIDEYHIEKPASAIAAR